MVKHLTVSGPTHRLVGTETKRLGLTRTEYADAAVRYFAERQLNPADIQAREGQLVMAEVKRLGDRVFSYLREQEQGLWVEILRALLETSATQAQVLRVVENLLVPEGGERLQSIRGINQEKVQKNVAAALAALGASSLKR